MSKTDKSIAEQIVEGSVCSLCCNFFVDEKGKPYEHSYPVVCKDCWKDLTPKERKMYQKAIKETL